MDLLKINNNEKVRKINEIGMFVLPIEVRKELELENEDYVEIFESNNSIIVKKLNVMHTIKEVKQDRIEEDNDTILFEDIHYVRIPRFSEDNRNKTVRRIDELGRIVIPIEVRKKLKIKENCELKVCTKDNMVILIKE